MNDADGRQWVAAHYPAEEARIAAFLGLVRHENESQNLVAPSTIGNLWGRHAVDSLQLLQWASPGLWTDIGTGGGFPGMVVAIARRSPIRLVEPRRRRAAFLRDSAAALGLDHVQVVQTRAETIDGTTAVISARAVSDIATLFDIGRRWATSTTRWILPRGQLSDTDMMTLTRCFGGMFHVEHSITAARSHIVVATGCPK